jgi:hypothetical protein
MIPVLGSAGWSVNVAFSPVCKPTPGAEILFLIVPLCKHEFCILSLLTLNFIIRNFFLNFQKVAIGWLQQPTF